MRGFSLISIFFFVLISQAFADGEDYQIVYSTFERNGEKLRWERLYEISKRGRRTEIQRRIYLDPKKELRSASFFDTDSRKWSTYVPPKITDDHRSDIRAADNLVSKTTLAKPEDADPDKLNKPAEPPKTECPVCPKPPGNIENAIVCEKAGGEFVICDGIPYRKERSGAVNDVNRSIKDPTPRRPAVPGPAVEEPNAAPVK